MSAEVSLDGLLSAFDDAIGRRATADWAGRTRAVAAHQVAKSDYAGLGLDPIAGPLTAMAERFALEPAASALLLVALGAELDPTLHLLCGLLSGDDTPGRPTCALAFELAGLSVLDGPARALLGELGTLRRNGLLTIDGDGPLPSRRLRVSERIVAHLLGNDLPPAELLPLLIDPVPVDVPGTETIARALATGEQFIWIHSAAGAAGIAMAAAACRAVDVFCLVADVRSALPVPQEQRDRTAAGTLVSSLLLEAALEGSVLVLVGAERVLDVLDLIQRAAVPVLAVSASPWDPGQGNTLPMSVTAPRTSLADRSALWAPILGLDEPPREITSLRLTPQDIQRVGKHARAIARINDAPITADVVRQATRRLGGHRNTRPAMDSSATMDDLILPSETRAEVVRLLSWARSRDEVLSQGPLQGKGGKGTGICALFSGSPGTGKTLAAHIIADSLGMDLISVELSSVVDKYIGETEKNLEKVFTEAESLNAILFFDEADSLFGSRSEVKDAKDRYANQEVAYLLQRMEQFDGITVLATNLRGNLDPAFSRRLHFVIHFPDPDAATRIGLWTAHLSHLSGIDPADPVLVEPLAAAVELAGGDIRNIVLSAAYAAVTDGTPVGMRHVVDAVIREYAKLGRRVPSGPIFHTTNR